MAAAGRDVYYSISGLLDAREKLHEHLRIGRRPAVLGVARMEVEDGSAGLRRADRLARHLVRGERQVSFHRLIMRRPPRSILFPYTTLFLLGALFFYRSAIWREEPAA